MTPVELSRTVLHAVRRAVEDGELSVTVPERAVVTAPGPGGRGDYATNIALRLARDAQQPATRVADVVGGYLRRVEGIGGVWVTGGGFINLQVAADAHLGLVRRILAEGQRYGYSLALHQQVVELLVPREVRAEVVAGAVARIVASQGGDVRIRCVAHGEPADLRPVPAPDDPAPLGHDAAQWALLHPAPHDRPRITADHLVQREQNPLFRVRYAHARTRAARRNAADLGFGPEAHAVSGSDTLLPLLADYPRVLTAAATHRAPDRLARHLVTVADAVLPLLPTVLPRGAEKPSAAHRARLALAEAAGAVLAGGLSLLGIDAPDHL
ncbi:ArgS-related anticodon-binding protein NrtL [Streptomyces sp. NPDC006997]|uniref:ArgS-related anticodon-binding protein NrtL n=1 Tax=Streptomyces sp. NPDC006997 TaxID=3155356 RepID=UPI0033C1CFF6